MPKPTLSPPVAREHLHTRSIALHGYKREDGLFDIEASLTDTKTYDFANHDRGNVTAGTPLHGMLARMTVNEAMLIVRFEAVTQYGPFNICPDAAPLFERLAGLSIGRGFIKAANERIGGVHGCTHLRELLGQMGTVAFQTMFAMRRKPAVPLDTPTATETAAPATASVDVPVPAKKPLLLGTCLAYAPSSPVVQRQYPEFFVPAVAAET